MTDTKFWDVKSLIENIPITKSTVYSKVSRKQIPYKKIGRKLIFNRQEILEWLDTGKKNNKSIEEDLPKLNF